MGTVDALDPLGFRAWHGRAQVMAVAHSHGDVELNLSPDAALHYQLDGTDVVIPPGRLAVLWGAVPHRLLAASTDPDGPAPGFAWVTIPLDLILGWDLPAGFVRDLVAGRLLVDHAGSPALDALLLGSWAEDLAATADGRPDRTTRLEVEARMRRMAFGRGWATAAGRPSSVAGAGVDPVEQIARMIVDRHTEPLSVAELAAAVGWHPTYAMGRFRTATGGTIGDYLTRQRVAHAQRLLVSTDQSVLDVAFDAGFGSVSRFHAAFRQVTGRTPGAYRRSMRRPPAVAGDELEAPT